MAKKPNAKRDLAGIASLYLPVFGGYFTLTLDKDQHTRMMDWMKIHPSERPDEHHFKGNGFCSNYTNQSGEWTAVIHICDWRLDTLVHELAHAVFMFCDYKGIEVDGGNRETFCYVQDYLFAEFYPIVLKRFQLEEDKKDAKE